MKNARLIILTTLVLFIFQPNLFAGERNLSGSCYQTLDRVCRGQLIDRGSGLIDGDIYSRPSVYPIDGCCMGRDPYRQAYNKRMEQLRRKEIQNWQRYRQEQGRSDADRDFYQSYRR